MTRCGLLLALGAVSIWGPLGCGGDNAPPEPQAPSPGVESPVDTDSTNSTTKKDSPTAVAPPETAVRNVLTGVRNGQAEPVWTFLPSRYQDGLDQLVQDFAEKVDAKVWDRTFASLQRLVKVAKSKKQLLINNPGLPLREMDQKQLDENWSTVIELFDIVLASELKEVKTLKTFSGKTFFAGTGTKFLERLHSLSSADPTDPLGKLTSSKVTVIQHGATTAQLQITSPDSDGNASPARNFVLVDGQWFPADLAVDLDELLRLGRVAVDAMPKSGTAASRNRWMSVLDAVDTSTSAMEKADTPEAFNKALANAQLAVIPLLAASSSEQPRDSKLVTTITVVLQGAMDEKARRGHIAALRGLAKSDESPDVTSSNDATTVILTTAQSLQTIIDGIKFGKVTGIDERKRTITVTPGQRSN